VGVALAAVSPTAVPLDTAVVGAAVEGAGLEVGTDDFGAPLDAARTPVNVGATEEFTTAAGCSWFADEREVRLARNHTMPTRTATASTTIATRRIQYTFELSGPTGCITDATVVSGRRFSWEQRRGVHCDCYRRTIGEKP
jgi:hypothetical protein